MEARDTREGSAFAVLAAGCFGAVEEFARAIPGVVDAVSGYTGGSQDDPSYEQECSGRTGHAEAVLVTFDPKVISYDRLLEEFWRHHDPTTPNRQGPEVGSRYRSAVFVHGAEQERITRESLQTFQDRFSRPIVTEASTF